jgi:hypothetical protein
MTRACVCVCVCVDTRVFPSCTYEPQNTYAHPYFTQYSYEEDVKTLKNLLPDVVQTVLMSATLPPEVEKMGSLILRDPITIQVDSEDVKEVRWVLL